MLILMASKAGCRYIAHMPEESNKQTIKQAK
jgi:hypothetical protein